MEPLPTHSDDTLDGLLGAAVLEFIAADDEEFELENVLKRWSDMRVSEQRQMQTLLLIRTAREVAVIGRNLKQQTAIQKQANKVADTQRRYNRGLAILALTVAVSAVLLGTGQSLVAPAVTAVTGGLAALLSAFLKGGLQS